MPVAIWLGVAGSSKRTEVSVVGVPLPTIEGLVYLMEDRFPFREMGSALVQVQFDGYRMIDGIPNFAIEWAT